MGGPRGPMAVGVSFGWPCMLAQCASNAHNALVNRHLRRAENLFSFPGFKNVFTRVIPVTVKSLYLKHLQANMLDEWRVGKSLVKLDSIDRSYQFDVPKSHRIVSFVKREVGEKIPTKARLIQGNANELTAYQHPDEYEALAGMLKDLRGVRFEYAGVNFQLVYAGGFNHDELSDHMTATIAESQNLLIHERDGKNWDATMNHELLRSEYDLLRYLRTKSAASFWTRCHESKGYVRCKVNGRTLYVRYVTYMKRLSGDWNTTFGNTTTNFNITVNAVAALPSHLKPVKAVIYAMGDDLCDFMSFTSRPDPYHLCSALNHFESRCGITPESGIFDDPLSISFISLTLWPRLGGGYQLVPKPARQMAKLFWAVKTVRAEDIPAYRNGIAEAFWHTFHGFGMMMKFLKAHFTPGVRPIPYAAYYSFMLNKQPRRVDWAAGVVYKYGLPMSATNFHWNPPARALVFTHPVLVWMQVIESQDPSERSRCLSRPPK